MLQIIVLLDDWGHIRHLLLLSFLLLVVFTVLILLMELSTLHVWRDRTLHLLQFSCKDIRIQNGCEVCLVVLLVICKPHSLPLRLVYLHGLLLLITDGGNKQNFVVLCLKGIDLADKV